MQTSKTFEELFCDHFQIARDEYTREAVFKCLYPHAVLFFRIFYALQTETIRESVRFIEKVGETRTSAELDDLISEYHNDTADTSNYLARGLNFRVSARSVARLNALLRGKAKSI